MCVFCKIVSGEIPSTKVYEDDCVLAFRDINPMAKVHIVVIPKEHALENAMEVNEENSCVIAKCFEAIAKIVKNEKLDKGFRVVTNCGEHGCQSVNHIHFHILGGEQLSPELN